jgi:hypothetical protein
MSKQRPYIGPSDAQANADALARRAAPYAPEHDRSKRFLPHGFDQLRRWFLAQWKDELPTDIHGAGEETERPGRILRDDGSGVTDPGGGNALGAPSYLPEFRVLIYGLENGDGTTRPGETQTEYATSGGHVETSKSYAYPLRWTITFLERQHPLMAAVLRRMGRMDGEYHGVSVTCGTCTSAVVLPDEYTEAIARRALALAAEAYRAEPEARAIGRNIA